MEELSEDQWLYSNSCGRRKLTEEPEVKNSYQYVFELREKLADTLKLAYSELEKAQRKGKHYYERKSKLRKFESGAKEGRRKELYLSVK